MRLTYRCASSTVFTVLAFLFAVSDLAGCKSKEQQQRIEANRFYPHVEEYGQIVDQSLSRPPAARFNGFEGGVITLTSLGYLGTSGKLGYTLNLSFLSLPPGLKPTSPADVRTIVTIECHRQVIGSYVDEATHLGGIAKAYQMQCTLTPIDAAKGVRLTQHLVFGPTPPDKTYNNNNGYGADISYEQLADSIVELSSNR